MNTPHCSTSSVRRRSTIRRFGFQRFEFLSTARVLLLGILTFAAGCCIDPVNGDRYFCLSELSDVEEGRLGESYAPNFVAEFGGEYPDPDLHAYLDEIVIDRMALKSHRPDLPWRFRILNTSQINAFALPGGQVFVTRGLLAKLQTEAQFAHLMGHEIGHVSHKHSSRGQGRALLFGILLGVVGELEAELSDAEFPLATTTLGIAGQLTLLRFSRDQELESDALGVDYAVSAGYDPRRGTDTFRLFLSLKQEAGQGESFIDGLLSTHPLDSTRIEEIEGYISDNYPGIESRDLTVSGPRWQNMIAGVRRAQGAYDEYDVAARLIAEVQQGEGSEASLDEAEERLRRGMRQLPGHAPFPLGLAFVELAREDTRRALTHADRAVTLDPDLYGARVLRGKLQLDLGRAQAAIPDLEAAQQLFPFNPQPFLYRGQAAEALGDVSGAIAAYEATLERVAEGTEIHTRARQRLEALRGGGQSAPAGAAPAR